MQYRYLCTIALLIDTSFVMQIGGIFRHIYCRHHHANSVRKCIVCKTLTAARVLLTALVDVAPRTAARTHCPAATYLNIVLLLQRQTEVLLDRATDVLGGGDKIS